MPWKPQAGPAAELKALSLSPLLGYVASRLDGATDLETLTALLSLPRARVEALVSELIVRGAVAPAPPEPASIQPASTQPAMAEPSPSAPAAPVTDASGLPFDEALAGEPSERSEAPAEDEAAAASGKQHRALFEAELREGTADERAAAAATATEPALSAWCFDPLPAVIGALLENPRFGLAHARLVARHHHNAVGLELLLRRAAFSADQIVRRALLQNPQLSGATFRRLWQARRPLELYGLAISREVLEQTRRSAREVLRARFSSGPAEERVEVLVKTEGRCLSLLPGLPIDAKTTSLLCARTYGSSTLVQNLARWSAAPPALIAHLLRQELVRRTPTLRTLLERHPNAPHRAQS